MFLIAPRLRQKMSYIILSTRTLTVLQISLALMIVKCSGGRKYILPQSHPVPVYKTGSVSPVHPQLEKLRSRSTVAHSSPSDGKSHFSAKYSGVNKNQNFSSPVIPYHESISTVHLDKKKIETYPYSDYWEKSGTPSSISHVEPPELTSFSTDYNSYYNYNAAPIGRYDMVDTHSPNLNSYIQSHRNDQNYNQAVTYNGYPSEFTEVEDKLFTQTLLATKLLKLGKFLFVLCMIFIVLIIAGIGKAGVVLSPVVLPLSLIPLGIIALLLFIPLFFIIIPVIAGGGGHGGKWQKRNRRDAIELNNFFDSLFVEIDGHLLAVEVRGYQNNHYDLIGTEVAQDEGWPLVVPLTFPGMIGITVQ